MAGKYSDQLRRQSRSIWQEIMAHPFLHELHAGTLPIDRFVYFILQDYVYLVDFAQVLCMGGAKSGNLETLSMFAHHALGAVEVERGFHASFGKEMGFTRQQLDAAKKGPVTEAYIAHLQSVARGGSLAELVAAVLPCYWIYGEVGKALYKNRPRKPVIYRRWIETYADESFWRPVREQIRLMNQLGAAANGAEKKHLLNYFQLSSRYEYLFWEQAYRLEQWRI